MLDSTGRIVKYGGSAALTTGHVLKWDGSRFTPQADATGGGGGTVTSVGLTVPSLLNVSGSPITTSGTFGVTWNSSPRRIPYFDEEGDDLTTQAGFTFDPVDEQRLNLPDGYELYIESSLDGGILQAGAASLRIFQLGDLSKNLTLSHSDIAFSTSLGGAVTLSKEDGATSYSVTYPAAAPGTDEVLTWDGANWVWAGIGGGGGTVTSVGLSVPSGFTVTGSPITSSGTLSISTTLSGLLYGTGSGIAATAFGSAYQIPRMNSFGTLMEFDSEIQDDGDNFRVGAGSTYGSLYNTIVGKGSKANGNHNTFVGIDINEANSASSQNIILGSNGTVALNAGNIVSLNPTQSHLRIGGFTQVGALNVLPTTGSYSDEGLNGMILIGYNNNITDPSTFKNGILVGNNVNFSSFAGTNTMYYTILGMNIVGSDGMQGSTIIGNAASVLNGEGNTTVIGRDAKAYLDGTYGSSGGHQVALGYTTFAGAWRSTAIGSYAQALAVSSTALGYGSYSNQAHAMAIGRGSYNNRANTLLFQLNADGTTDLLTTVYFGGQNAAWTNPAMPGSETIDFSTDLLAGNTYSVLTTITGKDTRPSPSLTNIPGGILRIMGGASTGTAAGGNLSLGVTLAGGASNNTENTWTPAFTIKGSDGHVYIDQNPDDDNTNTKVLARASDGEIEEISAIALTAPYNAAYIYEDFLNITTSETGEIGSHGFSFVNTGTGAQISMGTIGPTRPGAASVYTGTTTTGSSVITNGAFWSASGGETTVTFSIRFPNLSTASEEFIGRVGLHDGTTGDATDGVYFEYDRLTGGDFWRVATANNSTRTKITSTIAIAGNTWYRLKIVINAAGTEARYYVDDVEVSGGGYPITTNIPITAARSTALSFNIIKSAGTTTRALECDYIEYSQVLTTTR